MPPQGPREKGPEETLLHRQKEAANQLRLETLGSDDWLENPYYKAYERELLACPEPADRQEVLAACLNADIIYLGEFHAVEACQAYAVDLLQALAAGPGQVVLGVEFIYTRQQHLLDARQAGEMDDESFLRRIHYREEWGYPWSGYARLLDCARDNNVPVHALDVPPRGGYDGLKLRDRHAARRIARLLKSESVDKALILFGEAHLIRQHIPGAVRKRLSRYGIHRKPVTVFQDPDAMYWRLVESAGSHPEAARADESTWAVFHGSPLAKYEAYRQVLERWQGDVPHEEEVDLTPAVHHLISVLLDWMEIRPDRHRLVHQAGWAEALEDAFPEVYSGPDAIDLLAPVLEEHGRDKEDVADGVRLFQARGALYDSRSNTLFLERYYPGRAAGEGARFLRAALTGRLFLSADSAADPADRAYGSAYGEGLACLGTRLVDPASGSLADEDLAADSVVTDWLLAHKELERSRRRTPTEEFLEPLRGSRVVSRTLARHLGRRLGESLYQRVLSGRLDARGLRKLFARPLAMEQAPGLVLRLLRP